MHLRNLKVLPAAVLIAVLACCLPALAEKKAEEAILIVAFGTSVEKARVSYANVEKQVKGAFPGKEIRWAWTAHSLLKSSEGAAMLSPQEALARLGTEGFKKVSVLSLHVIPGQEYSNLVETAAAFEGLPKGLEEVQLSPPLLWDTDSMRVVAELLLKSVPKKRKAGEAVLFVGHGTHHPAGVYYPALQNYLNTSDPQAFVGTVEGDLDLAAVSKTLKMKGIKKVWLIPLMTVAGDHATNDLFGDEADSWKQTLKAAGIAVEEVKMGLGENPDLVSRWVKGLKAPKQEEKKD